jgi:hypothetical protein
MQVEHDYFILLKFFGNIILITIVADWIVKYFFYCLYLPT